MKLTEFQMEIIRLLKVLGVESETIIPAMLTVQDNNKAIEVLKKIIDMEDRGEELTAQKMLKIMAEV